MNALRRLSPALCAMLLAVALLGRAVLPSGWMPQADAAGIRIVLCTGNGPVSAVLAADGSVNHTGEAQPRDPCPFGLAGGLALDLPELPQLAAPLPAAAVAESQDPATAQSTIWRALRPPVRGPPALA